MGKDIGMRALQEIEQERKQIEARLWKAGYIASQPQRFSGKSAGCKVISHGGLVFIFYHTGADRSQITPVEEKRMELQMLIKYHDALREYNRQVDLFDDSEEPYLCL